MDEDSEITLTVIANDIDGDELSYEASSSDENVSSVFNNNELTLIPSLDWNGTVDITLTVSDSEESVVETFEKYLKPVNETLEGKDYLIGDFSAADIMLGHSCFMSNRLGCVSDEMANIKSYVERIENRPAFKKAIETQ